MSSLDSIAIALAGVGCVVFLAFAWGVRGHFASRRMPAGMMGVSLLSVAGLGAYLWSIGSTTLHAATSAGGMALQLSALWLFVAAVLATRATRLTLAFDQDLPSFLVAGGPFARIRHPFYASYLLFWTGCAVAAPSVLTGVTLVVLSAIYVRAARAEEAKFEASTLSLDYRRYRAHAGFLWPRLGYRA